MKGILFSLLVLLMCGLCANAQVKGFGKSYAFYKAKVQGNIMADDNGQPVVGLPHIERIIYLEVKGAVKPVVESVSYKGTLFYPSVFAVEDSIIGRRKKDGKQVVLQPAKGYRYWKIELHEAKDTVAKNNATPVDKNILVKAKKGKKPVTILVTEEDELLAEQMY